MIDKGRIDFVTSLSEALLLDHWGMNRNAQLTQDIRKRLLSDERPLSSLPGETAEFDYQTIAIAARGSKNRINCLRLCHLAFIVGAPAICELGTNLGISSAYLAIGAAVAAPNIRVRTGDMSEARIDVAKEIHDSIGLSNIDYVIGRFSETLNDLLQPTIGLCFVDGDHTYDGTLRYFDRIRPRMKTGGVIVFDDIDWSEDMRRAWSDIMKSEPFESKAAIDGMGYLQVL
jgi:predicted O-methyltransferase YrrM